MWLGKDFTFYLTYLTAVFVLFHFGGKTTAAACVLRATTKKGRQLF